MYYFAKNEPQPKFTKVNNCQEVYYFDKFCTLLFICEIFEYYEFSTLKNTFTAIEISGLV